MTAPEDLERAILGAAPDLTGAEVAERVGIDRKDSQRLWRALGFPEAGEQAAFNTADAEALARVVAMGREGHLEFDTIVKMTRAVGQTMDKLAEWEVATLAAVLDRSRSGDSQRQEALRLVQEVGPDFEQLLTYVWRRHLAAAIARVESVDVADEQLAEATVGFADLVSFSALTNRLEDDEIGNLVEVFESRSHDVVSRRRGRVVKTLGDSVLFMAASPEDGVEIAWDIVKVIGGDPRLPDVRVGLVTGSVVLRMGDVYGPAVNLAARLVGVAEPGQVLAPGDLCDLLPGWSARPLEPVALRGFSEPVTPYELRSPDG